MLENLPRRLNSFPLHGDGFLVGEINEFKVYVRPSWEPGVQGEHTMITVNWMNWVSIMEIADAAKMVDTLTEAIRLAETP